MVVREAKNSLSPPDSLVCGIYRNGFKKWHTSVESMIQGQLRVGESQTTSAALPQNDAFLSVFHRSKLRMKRGSIKLMGLLAPSNLLKNIVYESITPKYVTQNLLT